MNIILTGGSGFLGSALAKAFQSRGHRVYLLLRLSSTLTRLKNMEHFFDVLRYSSYEEIPKLVADSRPNFVIHTAGSYGRTNETDFEIFEANFFLGAKILQSLVEIAKPVTFINAGTALPPLVSLYALSKYQFSQWGRAIAKKRTSGVHFLNVLLQHIYGPGDDSSKFTTNVIHACRNQELVLELTEGLQRRDLIYIDDVVNAFLVVVQSYECLDHINELEVGSGVATSVREFAETVRRLTNSRTKLVFGAIPYRDGEPMFLQADVSSMAKLGWTPTFDLESGLRATIDGEFQN